jgi:hypothetical protein
MGEKRWPRKFTNGKEIFNPILLFKAAGPRLVWVKEVNGRLFKRLYRSMYAPPSQGGLMCQVYVYYGHTLLAQDSMHSPWETTQLGG